MSTLPVITNPNPHLRRQAKEISADKIKTKKLQEFCLDMAETMLKKDGVGLAATQVDENIRLVTIKDKEAILILINPKITKKSFARVWGEEGCLSVPGVYGQVRRHKKITCLYLDQAGKPKKIEASDMLARIIQHEVDHLDGILFIDKAKDLTEEKQKNE